jgi:DNA-binding response OmpR family regulator
MPEVQKTKRVLLVDDDPIVLRIYQDGLVRQGFEVSTAADGVAALRALRDNRPHIMVLDLMMPRLSGVEVLKFMRQEKELATLPVIVLSNAYFDPLAEGAATLGAQKGLLKIKCNPASLGAAIREVLEGTDTDLSPDQLLVAPQGEPQQNAPLAKPPSPPPENPAQPTSTPHNVRHITIPKVQRPPAPEQSITDSRDNARRELANNGPTISANLAQSFEMFQASRDNRERELRMQNFYRKVHFIAAMSGMAEIQALAQFVSAFEALLFGMMDDLPRLDASLVRTCGMAVEFIRQMLARLDRFGQRIYQDSWALVVDDDRLSNRLVISALRNAHLQAHSTDNAEDALRLLRENQFELILLDVEMPGGIDGIELCRRLRRLPGYETTPVIHVTIHSDLETREKSAESGGNDLIAKPVRPAELAVKVLMHVLNNPAAS